MLWTSNDSGDNLDAVWWWADEKAWQSLSSSSDGTKLAAVVSNGNIWTSADSGDSWTSRASAGDWTGIASSSDGTKLAAVVYNGNIWTSTDSGDSWTPGASPKNWQSIASSSDGTKLAAVVRGGNIWTFDSNCYASADASANGSDGNFYCVNGGVVGGATNECTCTCTAGYEGTNCQIVSETASACVASDTPTEDGSDGNFYCVNGGVVGGTAGNCTCTSCDVGYEGASCQTAKECAIAAPTNGSLGACTNSLGLGGACTYDCDDGYTVSGMTTCSTTGNVSLATCELDTALNKTSVTSPPSNNTVASPPPPPPPPETPLSLVLTDYESSASRRSAIFAAVAASVLIACVGTM
jgi:hypothetical protein